MPQTISMVSGTPFACPNVLFPLVFYWASTWFEEPVGMVADWPRFACFTYVALQMSINFIGLALDPARGKITVADVLRVLKARWIQ